MRPSITKNIGKSVLPSSILPKADAPLTIDATIDKDLGILQDRLINIKDTRKVRRTTGQPLKPTERRGGKVSEALLKDIVGYAKQYKINPYEAISRAIIESEGNPSYNNPFHLLYNPETNPAISKIKDSYRSGVEAGIVALKQKEKEFESLVKRGKVAPQKMELLKLQMYNGLGRIFPNTEGGQGKFYGVPIPKEGIKMTDNPLYAKELLDIMDIVKLNPDVKTIVEQAKPITKTTQYGPLKNQDYENYFTGPELFAKGGLIKRKDGSYSKRGLWDNIRANKGSGRKPTKEMLRQERKIRAAEKKEDGGPIYNWIPPNYPRVGARNAQGGWLDKYADGGSINDQKIPDTTAYEFGDKFMAYPDKTLTNYQMGTPKSTLPDGKKVDNNPQTPAYAHGATVWTKQTTPSWVAGTPTPTTTQREIVPSRTFSPGTAVPYPEVKITGPTDPYGPASPPVLQGYNPYKGPMRLHAPDTRRMGYGGIIPRYDFGSFITDVGKLGLNTLAAPLEQVTGNNFVNFNYANKSMADAAAISEGVLGAAADVAGTALLGPAYGMGKGMLQNVTKGVGTSTEEQRGANKWANKTGQIAGSTGNLIAGIASGNPQQIVGGAGELLGTTGGQFGSKELGMIGQLGSMSSMFLNPGSSAGLSKTSNLGGIGDIGTSSGLLMAKRGGRITKKYNPPGLRYQALNPGVSAPAGMTSGPITQRGITFADGGPTDNKRIITKDPADPALHAYLDSLNLHNAYLQQLKYNPPRGSQPKKGEYKKSDLAKYFDPSDAKDYWTSEAQFKKDVPREANLIDAYKKLTFSTPTTTALWTSPDLYNERIAPVNIYFGGHPEDIFTHKNPVFAKPKVPVEYVGNPADYMKYRSKPTIIGTSYKFKPEVSLPITKPEPVINISKIPMRGMSSFKIEKVVPQKTKVPAQSSIPAQYMDTRGEWSNKPQVPPVYTEEQLLKMGYRAPKKADGGDVDTLYVQSKNDPALRAYRDSSAAYETSQKFGKIFKKDPYDPEMMKYAKEMATSTDRLGLKPYKFLRGYDESSVREIPAEGRRLEEFWGGDTPTIALYKKPVRPVVYNPRPGMAKVPMRGMTSIPMEQLMPQRTSVGRTPELPATYRSWNTGEELEQIPAHLKIGSNWRTPQFKKKNGGWLDNL